MRYRETEGDFGTERDSPRRIFPAELVSFNEKIILLDQKSE